MLTEKFVEATRYAAAAHATQTRKGSNAPYTSHLLGVASLVLHYGGDEDQAIAGLLHDVVEDQGSHHEDEIRRRFGEKVARIVMACTDGSLESKAEATTAEAMRADWRKRKESYIDHLRKQPDDVLLVSGCDKLYNARSIAEDMRNAAVGQTVFDRFTGAREGTIWYYETLASVFREHATPMAGELSYAVAELTSPGSAA